MRVSTRRLALGPARLGGFEFQDFEGLESRVWVGYWATNSLLWFLCSTSRAPTPNLCSAEDRGAHGNTNLGQGHQMGSGLSGLGFRASASRSFKFVRSASYILWGEPYGTRLL